MLKIKIILFLFIALASCRDAYEFPLRETDVSLLVVEGMLNAGQGSTNIILSRTLRISDSTTFLPERGAKLTVEGKDGGVFNLSETGNGNYTHAQLPLIFGREYRLRIQTNNNKIYLSDYVVARQTPSIDSILWKKENGDLIIYANTHDDSNNSRYYKWDFDETWEIRSFYMTYFKWTGADIVQLPDPFNNVCWKYEKSNTILIGSTAQLASDVINEARIQLIPSGSEKLNVRYSMLLKQQTLTKEAYEYFNIMKRNTESIGTIFDPQPSELKGNIHCITNPGEDVVGYITSSSISEKRIFITAVETNWNYLQYCPGITVPNHPDSIKIHVPNYLPYYGEPGMGGGIIFYLMAPANCVDCTARGGNLNKPAYW